MRTVLDAGAVGRALRRIAHEIVEANDAIANLIVVGIQTRGVPMAHRISALVSEITQVDVPVGSLDVTRYRDDRDRGRPAATGYAGDLPTGVSGRTVVLVDDVLYTGRTARAGLEALNESGRPAGVQLAVLIDRGHRELPIRADYVGKNLPTAATERVTVRLRETDGVEGVVIESAVGSPAGGRAGG